MSTTSFYLFKEKIYTSLMPLFFLSALMGSVTKLPVDTVSMLLEGSGVDLLLTRLPESRVSGLQQAVDITKLHSNHSNLAWSRSSLTSDLPTRLYHMLLFALPGTPVFNLGDEVGLKKGVSTDQ